MQASQRLWVPPTGVLGQIIAAARQRLASMPSRDRRAVERRATDQAAPPSFAAALADGPEVAVIAEVKRRSPSRGDIRPGLAADDQARRYAEGGARAISVLTEESHFGGSLADLESVSRAVPLPVLRKDFTIDPFHLLEARGYGASAVLLIARALSPTQLATLYRAAGQLNLECVVEVRSEAELELALQLSPGLIGVNSRDLETLEVDHGVRAHLLSRIPAGVVAIAESGVSSADDVRAAAAFGADAVLVGSSLSAAADPSAAVRELTGVRRVPRRG
ncbi:MAG TPA: indole-3-glycerol phosphate synthase TrpC [Gemmatimonadaceae bacterium]|nr:indole-3-glycerol phosphate synthase TrpC [Gemmatimonadaceae bacterium]